MRTGIALLVLVSGMVPALADDPITVNDVFGIYGFKSSESISGNSCKIEMNLDQSEFIEKVPDLQKIGLLNDNITSEKITSEPDVLSLAFMIQMASATTKDFYERNPSVDKCSFAAIVTSKDDYGHDLQINAFSFGFDRKTYKRIDWEHFQDQKIAKVATNFRFVPAFMLKVKSEIDAAE